MLEYEVKYDYFPPIKKDLLRRRKIAVEEIYVPFTFRDGELIVLLSKLWEN